MGVKLPRNDRVPMNEIPREDCWRRKIRRTTVTDVFGIHSTVRYRVFPCSSRPAVLDKLYGRVLCDAASPKLEGHADLLRPLADAGDGYSVLAANGASSDEEPRVALVPVRGDEQHNPQYGCKRDGRAPRQLIEIEEVHVEIHAWADRARGEVEEIGAGAVTVEDEDALEARATEDCKGLLRAEAAVGLFAAELGQRGGEEGEEGAADGDCEDNVVAAAVEDPGDSGDSELGDDGEVAHVEG